jgi:hypothetical protein
VKNVIFGLSILSLLALLAGMIAAGWQSRYLADDYCYDAQFNQHGFWQGQVDSYLNAMPYSSNRYSLTFFYGVGWALGGVKLAPVLPGLAILLWGSALYYVIQQGIIVAGKKLPILAIAFAAATILFFTLLLAPNRYQVLYWRSGMLTYLAPLVINTLLAGRFLHYLQRDHLGGVGWLELSLVTWIAAGFSETAFAVQTGFWSLVLLVMLWRRQGTGCKAMAAILLGIAAGAALLLLNPTNAVRQSPFPPPPSLWTLVSTSLQYARDFAFYSVRGAPLPFLALMGAGILLGWLEFPVKSFRWRLAFAHLIGAGLGAGFLLVCVMAPTMWSMSVYPGSRALLTGEYLIILFLFSAGIWVGAAGAAVLQRFASVHRRLAAGFLMMLVLCAYSIHLIPSTYAPIAGYRQRAVAWDARNMMILQARSTGQTDLVVPGIDSIAEIFELQPNAGHWVNRCAAQYYGLQGITTTE